MAIDFEAAFYYPYREENRKNTVWIPGAGIYAHGILSFLVTLGVYAIAMSILGFGVGDLLEPNSARSLNEHPAMMLADVINNLVISPLLASVLSVLMLGHLWQLFGQWQQDGFMAKAPDWAKSWKSITLDGLKGYLYYLAIGLIVTIITVSVLAVVLIVSGVSLNLFSADGAMADKNLQVGLYGGFIFVFVFIMMAIGLIAFVLLTPYFYGPLILTGDDRRLGNLFNLPKSYRTITARYKDCLVAMLYIALTTVIYLVGYGLAAFLIIACCIGCIGLLLAPFVMYPAYVTCAHLLAQALLAPHGDLRKPGEEDFARAKNLFPDQPDLNL